MHLLESLPFCAFISHAQLERVKVRILNYHILIYIYSEMHRF